MTPGLVLEQALAILAEANRATFTPPAVAPARAPDGPSFNPCPTCPDGRLTIVHPRRCRECIAAGL